MKDKFLFSFALVLCIIGFALITAIYFTHTKKDEVVTTSSSNLNLQDEKTFNEIDNLNQIDDVEVTFIKNEDIQFNEIAEILVIMYHGLTPSDVYGDIVHRSVEGFEEDLQTLYDNNYRIITMEQYINKDFNIEAGFSPVLITFDDGLSSAFSFDYVDNQLIPKKDTAVDILDKFSQKYPDFGKSATFFVYNKNDAFAGYGTLMDRFNHLIYNGYDIGNHSYSHKDLQNLENEEITTEIGLNHNVVYQNSENYNMNAFVYPYGNLPKTDNFEEIFNNEFEDVTFNYEVAFLAYPLETYSTNPFSSKFNKYKIPRIRGTNNEVFDLGYYLEYYENNPSEKYISDGLDGVITVPYEKFHELNMDIVKEKKYNVNVVGN